MPRKITAGVPVRGTCAAGHVVDATSDPGRVTWEGRCTHNGCENKVKAKRLPHDRAPAPKPDPKPATSPARAGARKLIVTRTPDAASKPKPATRANRPDDDSGTAGGADGAGVRPGRPDAGGAGLVDDTGVREGPHHASRQARDNGGRWRETLRGRLARGRARDAGHDDDEDSPLPGVF